MSKEKNMGSGLLIIAIVAIIAIVGLVLFFNANSTKTVTGNADTVDAVILDIVGSQNIAGQAISTACRDSVHRACDSASNQRNCVQNQACLY